MREAFTDAMFFFASSRRHVSAHASFALHDARETRHGHARPPHPYLLLALPQNTSCNPASRLPCRAPRCLFP